MEYSIEADKYFAVVKVGIEDTESFGYNNRPKEMSEFIVLEFMFVEVPRAAPRATICC